MFATRNWAGHDRGWRTRARLRAHLFVQSLENRLTPAQFVVTSSADSGAGSLRAAIASSNTNAEADTITFDPGVTTINLTTGQMTISEGKDLLMDGSGKVTINGAAVASATNRIFLVASKGPATTTINGLTLSNAKLIGFGGAIHCSSTGTELRLSNLTVSNNSASESGGGISTFGGKLQLTNVTLNRNEVSSSNNSKGGGLYVTNKAVISLFDSTVSFNSAPGASGINQGGGICIESSTLNVTNSLIAGNSASRSCDLCRDLNQSKHPLSG